MDGTQAPPTVIDGLNSCVDSFITNTVDQLSLKMQQGFSRGATVDQMTSTLTLAFADKAQRFHSRVKDFYTQAAWHGVLQSYDTGQRFVFQVDKQDGTCERCSAQGGVIYTADEIVQNDLLPPLHPNCRCSILTFEQALQIGGGGDMKQDRIQLEMDDGEQSQNSVLEPLMRIPSDAADMVHSFQLAQLARLQNGQYLDWVTAGIVSGFWAGLETRAQTMLDNPTLYNIGNWLTLGLFDVIKGALFPEEPLSLQHWLDSAGLAAAYGGYKTYQQVKSLYSEKGSRGSAGVYEALDDKATSSFNDTYDATDAVLNSENSSKQLVLKGTKYSAEYVQKLKNTYRIFIDNGYEVSEHGLNRILGRINQGKISSIEEIVDVLKTGTKYTDTVNGGTVIFKNGISVHIAEDNFIKTVIGNAKIKSAWEIVE